VVRLRRWNLYGSATWHSSGGPGVAPDITPFSASDPSYINNGESNLFGLETSPFSDIDDIFEVWRKTYSDGIAGPPGGIRIFWGPLGGYDISGGTSGGSLDSELLIQANDGDNVFYCGSQLNRDMGAPNGLLNNPANIDFTFIDCAGNSLSVPLYFDNSDLAGDPSGNDTLDWDGTIVMQPGDLWWPWLLNGDDTWDTTTGTQLEDPLRGLSWVSGERSRLARQA
jgi:hypothetical protein